MDRDGDHRILVVDDDDQIRRMIARVLEQWGYPCETVADAAEARARLQEREFALVFLDVRMPGGSSSDLLHHIATRHKNTAVIMETAVNDPMFAESAIAMGAYGYIAKPFDPNEVIINAHNALRRRSLEIENRAYGELLEQTVRERTEELQDTIQRLQEAEATARAVEARTGAVLESALDCIVMMDHQGTILEFNPAAERTFGYARENVIGKKMADVIIPPRFRESHRNGLVHYLETGEGPVLGQRLELSGLRSDGTEFPVELAVTRVDLPGPPLFTGYLRDLTQRRRDEEELLRLAAIVESSEDSIVGKTLDGVITSWNAGAEKLYRYSADEIVGSPFSVLISPDRPDELTEILERIGAGESVEHFETVRVRKDGTPIDVSVTVSPVRDRTGTIVGASSIARDITERKQGERERVTLLEEAQAARVEAERAARRLARLQRIADAALAHLELEELLDQLLDRVRSALQADTATILLLSEEGDRLVVRGSRGLEEEADAIVEIPVGEGFSGRIAATREPMIVNDVSEMPIPTPLLKQNVRALIGAPLMIGKNLYGVVHVGSFTEREFTAEDLGLLELVADRAARAIGHARLFEAERQARSEAESNQERLAFLAEASRVLASSLDIEATLRKVAELAVPQVADWCAVDIAEGDGSFRSVAIAHKDPEKVRWARELQERYPPDPNAATGVPNVLRTGQPEMYPEITEEMIGAAALDEEQLQIIGQLGMKSAMVVPLAVRKRVFGAITLISAESGKQFGPGELELAEELARRAAQAIENARLFEAESGARNESEENQKRLEFMVEASRVLASSLDYEGTLRQVAELAVSRIADWCVVNVVEEDGSIRDLAAAHRDPQKVQWMYDLQKGFKPEGASSIGVPNVIRTGVSEIYPTVTDEVLTAAAADPGHLDILKKAGIRSAIIVPVSSRDRVLGTITLVSTESGRQYGPADLRLAEELARRAAQSIENSRLHQEVQARVEEVQRLNEQLEDRVAERTAQLEAANKELEGFSYSVSHDLRAPLRAIDGFSRILLKEYGEQLPERAHGFLGIVREGAQQMGHLIDDLLAFARLGRQALNVQQVDMRELVGGCIEELRSGEDDRLVEIVVGELPPCQADPVFLKQVFFNLVSNALKFTRNTGVPRIEVGSFEQNGDLVYYVRDNGVGFDMKYADKLFGVFQRLHRAEDYEGTGVGLAIVQRVVHRHGGRVWAEAEVDKGATFYMTFQKGNGGD